MTIRNRKFLSRSRKFRFGFSVFDSVEFQNSMHLPAIECRIKFGHRDKHFHLLSETQKTLTAARVGQRRIFMFYREHFRFSGCAERAIDDF